MRYLNRWNTIWISNAIIYICKSIGWINYYSLCCFSMMLGYFTFITCIQQPNSWWTSTSDPKLELITFMYIWLKVDSFEIIITLAALLYLYRFAGWHKAIVNFFHQHLNIKHPTDTFRTETINILKDFN